MTGHTLKVRLYAAALAAVAMTLAWTGAAQADDGLSAALGKCKGIESDSERLVCFDAVAAMTGDEKAAAPAPEPASPPTEPAPAVATRTEAPGVVPLNDEVGKERVDGARTEETPKYAGTVTRCEESRQSGQTYFFFENGQVWKQANYRRLNLRNCRFDVTVAKDTFGYELHIPSKDRRVRVSRIR